VCVCMSPPHFILETKHCTRVIIHSVVWLFFSLTRPLHFVVE
jgi:hypothetical protein